MKKTLESHEMYFSLQEGLIPIAKELLKAKNEHRGAIFTKNQVRIKNLFNYLTEIVNKQQDIQIAKEFLKSHKSVGRNSKNVQIRSACIKYHIEFYQINIIGVFDRILHLINFIYKLGLADRHVKKDTICSNSNIPKKLVHLVNKFDKDVESVRSSQNSIKHKEKIHIPELYNAELLDFTLRQWAEIKKEKIKVNFSWSKQDEKSLKSDADFYYNIFLRNESKKIDEINTKLNQNILDILDVLLAHSKDGPY